MNCLWGCSGPNTSVPAADANRKSKTQRSAAVTVFQHTLQTAPWGRAPAAAEQGQGAQVVLGSGCTAALGAQAGLPLSSLHHLTTPASVQLWPKVAESGRAAGMKRRWHPHSLPTADDRRIRRERGFGLGATSPPCPLS